MRLSNESHSTFCKGTNTEGIYKMLAYRCYKSDNSGKKNHPILLAKSDRIVFNFFLVLYSLFCFRQNLDIM